MSPLKPKIPWLVILAALQVSAGSLQAGALPTGIAILDPDQILEERTQLEQGNLYLCDAEGTLRRFITSTDDPLVLNPGSGAFHPLGTGAVEEALLAVDGRFLEGLCFEAFILPYPVAHPMTSWAGEGAVYLSPGVWELLNEQVQHLVAHEVGHLVHRAYLADDDLVGWQRYRLLRGIQDTNRYHANAAHRDRPHEIFAEDFRVLFGGMLARGGGEVENSDLVAPEEVAGLRAFFLELIGVEPEPKPETLALAYPNPVSTSQPLHLSLQGVETVSAVVIHDVSGRSVRVLRDLTVLGHGLFEMRWDGKDSAGRDLPRGAYFCEIRTDGPVRRLEFCLVR